MAAKKFVIPFASAGDKAPVPNTLQPDGTVSYAQGFGPDYELDKMVDPVNAKDVPRDQSNQIYYDITDAVGEIQAKGFAPWSSDLDYAAKAFVVGPSNGLLYVAIQGSGPSTAARNPEAETAYWQPFAMRGMTVFDTAGVTSWDVPVAMQLGIIKPEYEITGGGGGGARGNAASGGGGAGAGTAYGVLDLTGVTSVTITVGVGGAGAITNNTAGSPGGTSSIGAFASSPGALGGVPLGRVEGSTPVGGSLNVRGGSGANANPDLASGGGAGGDSRYGQGGISGTASLDSLSGSGYGSGGAGGGASGKSGAPGANGLIRIKW